MCIRGNTVNIEYLKPESFKAFKLYVITMD